MKKFLLLIPIFCLSILLVNDYRVKASNALDYTNGWFDNNPDKFTINYPNVIDNDTNTYTNISSSQKVVVEFNEGINLDILSFYADASNYNHFYHFYNSSGEIIKTYQLNLSSSDSEKVYIPLNIKDVKKIVITRLSSNYTRIREIEVFETKPRNTVSELKVTNKTHSSVNLKWINPEDNDFSNVLIKQGNEVITTLDASATSYNIKGLNINTDYEFEVAAVYEDGTISKGMKVTAKTNEAPKVKELQAATTSNSAELSWVNGVTDHEGIVIYKDNVKVIQLSKNNTTYTINNLNTETTYTYQVALLFKNGVESEKENITFKTSAIKKEVSNLKAIAKDFRAVDLTWKNTEHDKFETVTIYRKVNEQPSIMARMASLFSLNNTTEEYEPLFQTNGTTFKDMTVAADTDYTYKVTTTIEGVETPGETVTIKTPKLKIIGGGVEETEEGDFVFNWVDPTKGNVEVYVGNELFKTVPASDLKITIPKDKMKYDLLGSPDVKLIPIDENGNPGQATKPGSGMGLGGTKMPESLTPQNVLLSGVGLLGVVGGFVLLGLVWAFMPKLIKLIRQAFLNKRGAS